MSALSIESALTRTAGVRIPHDINAIIEISAHSTPVKYEFDKSYGMLVVDRFLEVAMQYPCNYGYIPATLGGDGDPLDVLVVTPYPVQPGVLIRCRPVGVLRMTDGGEEDAKILAVPIDKLSKQYQHVQSPTDLPISLTKALTHFFEHYKDLDTNKLVKVEGWLGVEAAQEEILAGVEQYQKKMLEEKKH